MSSHANIGLYKGLVDKGVARVQGVVLHLCAQRCQDAAAGIELCRDPCGVKRPASDAHTQERGIFPPFLAWLLDASFSLGVFDSRNASLWGSRCVRRLVV